MNPDASNGTGSNRRTPDGWSQLGSDKVWFTARKSVTTRMDPSSTNAAFWSIEIARSFAIPDTAVMIQAVRGRAPSAVISGDPVAISYASTTGWRACAVSTRGPIGIDIEAPINFPEIDAMLVRAGDDAAYREDSARLGWGPRERLRRMWTAKEAVLKAAGVGLRIDPREVLLQSPTLDGCGAALAGDEWSISWCETNDAVIAIATPL